MALVLSTIIINQFTQIHYKKQSNRQAQSEFLYNFQQNTQG